MQPHQIFNSVWVHGKPAYKYRRTKKFKPSPVFEWRPHQMEQGTKAWGLLSTTGWVYLMHDARTGKTGTALYALEYHPQTLNVLIVTTKNGIWGVEKDQVNGWVGFIAEAKAHGWLKHNYFITNHHSIKKGLPEGVSPNVVVLDECFTGDAEVLTNEGFKRFDSLNGTELIAQVDKDTLEITFVKPLKYIHNRDRSDLVRVWNDKGIDLISTEGHEYLHYYEKYQSGDTPIAKKAVARNLNRRKDHYMASTGFSTQGMSNITPSIKLAIAYQADGTIYYRNKGGVATATLRFEFSKEEKIYKFLDLIKYLPYETKELTSCTRGRTTSRVFVIYKVPLSIISKDLKTLYKVSDFNYQAARDFIQYALIWDGSENADYPHLKQYSSTVKGSVDLIQELCTIAGYKSKLILRKRGASHHRHLYSLAINTKKLGFSLTSLHIDKVNLRADVYCVTVPKGNIVVRREGKPVVTGNCHKNFSKPHPTESKLWREAKMVIGKCPVIFLSATPHAQTIMQIYWQLALCIYTPFIQAGYDTFDKWFKDFGVAKTKYVGNGVAMPVYDEAKDEELIESYIKNNFLALRYTDVGGKEELEPVDKKHYVELTGVVKQIYDTYQEKEVVQLNDTVVRTMSAGDVPRRLHQIEGATLKYQDVFAITDPESGVRYRGVKPNEYFFTFPVHDKIEYIKKIWGDTDKIVIMYEYILEGKLLRSQFKHAKILQGTTNAEAIDLWQYDDMIIYSMNWSTSSYIQRRDRQKHLTKRTKPITIHYLLVKGGVSEMVFDTVVTNKEDFTDKYYKIRKNFKAPEYV